MDLLQSIGKTPLIRLAKLTAGLDARFWSKSNPATRAAPSKTVPPSV
ncbi:MAG: hypothetical protein ACLSAH_06550 [Bilophila wadsworthia]